MIYFPQAGATILMRRRKKAVVFDAKTPHILGTRIEIGERIDFSFEIIHHVARVIIDFDERVVDLSRDFRARRSRSRFSAMLLNDEQHVRISAPRGELAKALYPELGVPASGVTKCQYLRYPSRRGLANPLAEDFEPVLGFRVDSREHHDGFQPQIATALAEFTGSIRGSVGWHHGDLLAIFTMGRPPGNEAIAWPYDERRWIVCERHERDGDRDGKRWLHFCELDRRRHTGEHERELPLHRQRDRS